MEDHKAAQWSLKSIIDPVHCIAYISRVRVLFCSSDFYYVHYTLCRTRYVGKCSSVGHDVRFERVVMVLGVYFYDIDVGRQDFS